MTSSNSKLKVWLDGRIIKYDEATVPILNHSMQYGSGIFEGIRGFLDENTVKIFRLDDHVKRFFNSMNIYSMSIEFSREEIRDAIIETVEKNDVGNCYIRPFSFVNDDSIGLSRYNKKISTYIAVVPFTDYIGGVKPVTAKISSWRRINSNILPVQAKASANYANSILANIEARALGYDEAIILDVEGNVAEGSGENIFLVKSGEILTPSLDSDVLEGITRNTVISIADDTGIVTVERKIHREELFTADELFYCGTAAGITPVSKVDDRVINKGKEGNITGKIKKKYHDLVRGLDPRHSDWVTTVRHRR